MINGKNYYFNEEGVCKTKFGIDVATYQGQINWEAAKAGGVEFAIIRIGYGMDLAEQDDNTAIRKLHLR
ncbi:MAG: hypothetical protein GX225_01310 [Clostridiales bacterium]|nr:hypothetical protein [Clostridiales bacterium]